MSEEEVTAERVEVAERMEIRRLIEAYGLVATQLYRDARAVAGAGYIAQPDAPVIVQGGPGT